METKKLIVIVMVFVLSNASAQRIPISQSRTGFIRAQGNLAGGYLFSQKNYTAYITGDADAYVSERVSVARDIWYSIPLADNSLQQNHSLFGGLNYHFVKHSNWDPFIGFSPGLGISKVVFDDGLGNRKISSFTASPLVSAVTGVNWYLGSIFHLFLKARWVYGISMNNAPFSTSLHEIKITAGLGWNLRAWKPKT